MRPLETEHYDCECYSPEHSVRFIYDPDYGDLYLSVFLRKWIFWKRIWIGIKYMFGYTSKYGDFDGGAAFRKEDLQSLIVLLERAKKRKEEVREELALAAKKTEKEQVKKEEDIVEKE